MQKAIQSREEALAWHEKYDFLAPQVGHVAPDFQLWDVAGEEAVQLSDFHGQKPVALVFGSFT